jgi:hypothetical protein
MRAVARFCLFRLTLVFAGVVGSSRAADGWQQLKVGMTRSEATAVLGHALLTNQARGFTVQIYDAGAEVVLVHGRVASWTAPAGSRSVAPEFHPWPIQPVGFKPPSAVPPQSGRSSTRDAKSRQPSTLPAYRL